MQSFAVVSLGCPKNQVDLEFLIHRLEVAGFDFLANTSDADLVIINTCAFIESAREQAVDTILSYARLKQDRPSLKIAVSGCLVQRYGGSLVSSIPEVDFWLNGPEDERGIDRIISAAGRAQVPAEPCVGRNVFLGEPGSAYLKIAEGCDNHCCYCAIPIIKGGLESRSKEDILLDAAGLVEQGIGEIVLVAQDLTAYGNDLPSHDATLELLLEGLLALPIRWIRLMYNYPGRLSRKVRQLMASEPQLCPYLDIPFQHADPRVLHLMGRVGSGEQYLDEVAELREEIPGLVLRTTFLVGHPGEDSRAYGRLKRFVERASFEWLGVFPYSLEEGTLSAEMSRRPRESTAQRRAQELQDIYREVRCIDAFGLGRKKEAVVTDEVNDILICRSQTEAPEVDGVILVSNDDCGVSPAPGSFVSVELSEEAGLDFTGVLRRLLP